MRGPLQLLACIGEMFTDSDDICGLVAGLRKTQGRISLWTKSGDNENLQVGSFKASPFRRMCFIDGNDSMREDVCKV